MGKHFDKTIKNEKKTMENEASYVDEFVTYVFYSIFQAISEQKRSVLYHCRIRKFRFQK